MESLKNNSPSHTPYDRGKTPVLLDTNFVISCYTFNIQLDDISSLVEEAHEICVPQNVLDELSSLGLKGKDREARDIMLQVLKRYRTLPLEGNVDHSLVSFARSHDCIICTNDRILRKKINRLGRRVIFVRSRSHLVLQ
jgi:rRNA-processing protein FCF1